ncbi:MAG: 50S ribosomal protein L1 [Nitrospiria bacterium]
MGKKYNAEVQKVETGLYSLKEGCALVKEVHYAKFDGSVDLAIRLGVDPRHSDQMVRGSVLLPHGTGRTVRILVFAKGEKEKEALDAGADFVGVDDMLEKINSGWLEFDRVIATPDLMGVVGRLGRVLGPRGLMPNPKTGTVTFDIAKTVNEIKKGKVEYRVEKAGIIHVSVGRVSFAPEQLYENALAVFDSIVRQKPAAAKGKYIRSVVISPTMGPGITIDEGTLRPEKAAA